VGGGYVGLLSPCSFVGLLLFHVRLLWCGLPCVGCAGQPRVVWVWCCFLWLVGVAVFLLGFVVRGRFVSCDACF